MKVRVMFTGLIQCMGRIKKINKTAQDCRIHIQPLNSIQDLLPGESIAVNGVCLTIEAAANDHFLVYASAETLSKTNLLSLNHGDYVNLERALAVGDRLGGHIISGHVDCLAKIQDFVQTGDSYTYRVLFDTQWSKYIVPKGSIALDGISLTVNDCGKGFLEVNIIPFTRKETTIFYWQRGTLVNMETDIIGKYVQKMLSPWQNLPEAQNRPITLDFLREHGF